MGAPLIVPKGNDRSWTKAFYRAINKIFRRMWWEQDMDDQVQNACEQALLHGHGFVRFEVRP